MGRSVDVNVAQQGRYAHTRTFSQHSCEFNRPFSGLESVGNRTETSRHRYRATASRQIARFTSSNFQSAQKIFVSSGSQS